MYAQNALSSISQSDAEWRRERDFIDAELTANTIRNQARKKGLLEGRELKAIEDAKEFLKENIAPEIIAKCVKLPLDQVLELQKEINA